MKYIELTPLLEKHYDNTTIHYWAHDISAHIYSKFTPMFRQRIRLIYNETDLH